MIYGDMALLSHNAGNGADRNFDDVPSSSRMPVLESDREYFRYGADPTTLSLGAIWRDRLAAADPEMDRILIRRKTYSNRVSFRDQLPRHAFGPYLEEQ